MDGQTIFFDFLSRESLPRESVHGKTVEGKGSTLSGIENFSQRRECCTGDLNADCCLAVKTISQRVRVETNIEDK